MVSKDVGWYVALLEYTCYNVIIDVNIDVN